jgi:hypothetical protein
VELASDCGNFEALPVLRSFRGLARLGSAVQRSRVIDTTSLSALGDAFQGSTTVVNLTLGDRSQILEDTQLVYNACVRAGVRQLIHLSSAVVFGRVTDPSIHDDSPPDTRSWMLYARGKARADVWLRQQLGRQKLQVVVLRPGLIWGPGSNWSEMVGDQLSHGSVVLSNHGKGIANLVFIDNLARIVLTIAARPEGPSGFYNVGDHETICWEQLYRELALRLGYSSQAVRFWPDNRLRIRPTHAVEWALERAPLYRIAMMLWNQYLSGGTKEMIKAKLKGPPEPPGVKEGAGYPPRLSRANWVLENTVHRLPTSKVQRDYGPLELVSFAQALDNTAAWLKFAGFGHPDAVSVLV